MCCSCLLKTIMVIVNGTIFLVGAGILGLGIWVTVDSASLLSTLQNFIEDAPELKQLGSVGYLFIGIGTPLTLVGFLGCCGAMRESRCMLLTFFVIVLILFIAQVAGAAVLLVLQPKVSEQFEKIGVNITASIEKEYGMSDSLTAFWNTTMKEFECCGYNNYTDFTTSPYFIRTNLYPAECCQDNDNNCTTTAAHTDNIKGCSKPLIYLIEHSAYVVGVVGLGVCAVEVFAMIFSMVLFKKAGK